VVAEVVAVGAAVEETGMGEWNSAGTSARSASWVEGQMDGCISGRLEHLAPCFFFSVARTWKRSIGSSSLKPMSSLLPIAWNMWYSVTSSMWAVDAQLSGGVKR
jgi:hypothetical protein